jgi:hypothetical protein
MPWWKTTYIAEHAVCTIVFPIMRGTNSIHLSLGILSHLVSYVLPHANRQKRHGDEDDQRY